LDREPGRRCRLDFNEGAKVGQVTHPASTIVPAGYFSSGFPTDFEKLLHAQGDAATAGLTLSTTVDFVVGLTSWRDA